MTSNVPLQTRRAFGIRRRRLVGDQTSFAIEGVLRDGVARVVVYGPLTRVNAHSVEEAISKLAPYASGGVVIELADGDRSRFAQQWLNAHRPPDTFESSRAPLAGREEFASPVQGFGAALAPGVMSDAGDTGEESGTSAAIAF